MSEYNKEIYTSEENLVKNFLNEVRRKLPFWLKDQKKDVDEILEELENHIWDRATELAEGSDPSPDQIEQVINQMGSPAKIASEYKRRGKPKYFITEELWPQYQRSLIIFGAVLIGLNIIIGLFRIGSHTAGEIFGGIFQGIFTSLAIVTILTTIIFAALSHEGYLPDDLEGKVPFFVINLRGLRTRSDESRATQAEPAAKAVTEDKPVRILKEESLPPVEKTTMVKEPTTTIVREKVIIEPRTVYVDRPRPKTKRKRKHYLGRDYLGEGISGIIFGTIIMILPFMPFLDFLAMPSALKYWFLIFGGMCLVLGLIRFFQAIIGRMVHFQQLLMILGMIPRAANIPLFLALLNRPYILLTWLQNIIPESAISDYYVLVIVKVVVWFTVVTTALSLIAELSRMIKLGVNGYPDD
ncbi:MAG: HAAS signaling domain-containing protein [Candidatus Heimdallarchaeota archaeon]